MIWDQLLELLFPPKCILCRKVLSKDQTDLCHHCRRETEDFKKSNHNISFVAGWTSMWYYNGKVRDSILRYKFHHYRNYGAVYGRLLAMRLWSDPLWEFDLLTWVPVSQRRKRSRGFDQVELIAQSAAEEMGMELTPCLKKIRHTQPQSRLKDYSHRKANVLGAFSVIDPSIIKDKRILLIDDIITTGATVSECARTLLTAGAKEVYCAAAAALNKEKRR